MNIENMKRLRERYATIQKLGLEGERFDMSTWVSGDYWDAIDCPKADRPGDADDCGTACCVAGEACLLFADWGEVRSDWDVESVARRHLGLSVGEAERLFRGHFVGDSKRSTSGTPVLAVITLDDVIPELDRMIADAEARP